MVPVSDPKFGRKLHCKGCAEEIFSKSRLSVQCVDCTQEGLESSDQVVSFSMDLCPECFSGGVEIGNHKSNHRYRFLDDGGFVLLSSPPIPEGSRPWTAREQLLLLNLIERHGYGNWEDIARAVNVELGITNTNNPNYKTPGAVRDQHTATFLLGPTAKHTWKEELRGKVKDHTDTNPKMDAAPPSSSLTSHESILLGYLPIRDDFEIEYENDAEAIVSHLQYEPTQSSGQTSAAAASAGGILSLIPQDEDELLDQELKACQVEMYRSKLSEREKRKKVSADHQLMSRFFRENPIMYDNRGHAVLSASKPKKASSEAMDKLKLLAEFQTVSEFQSLMLSLAKEKELKARVRELQRYKKNGIGTLAEAVEFDGQQKLRRLSNRHVDVLSTAQEGLELLSANEKRLCSHLNLTPAHYISYKTCLLTNHLQRRKGQKPPNLVGLDKNNRKVIFNFLMRAGWITAF